MFSSQLNLWPISRTIPKPQVISFSVHVILFLFVPVIKFFFYEKKYIWVIVSNVNLSFNQILYTQFFSLHKGLSLRFSIPNSFWFISKPSYFLIWFVSLSKIFYENLTFVYFSFRINCLNCSEIRENFQYKLDTKVGDKGLFLCLLFIYFSLFFASSILVQFKIRNMKVYLLILCIKISTLHEYWWSDAQSSSFNFCSNFQLRKCNK
jgi:hypothetical protein